MIYTSATDRGKIDTAAEIEALRQYTDVEIETLDTDMLENPIEAHHAAWEMAVERARSERNFVMLMPPDTAWSENSMASVARAIDAGYKAIFQTFLRAETNSFVSAVDDYRAKERGSISIPGKTLVDLCFQCLHPLMAAYLRYSEYFPSHAEMVIWPIPKEGVLVRVLAREMFLFDPSAVRTTKNCLMAEPPKPGEAKFFDDSDELFAVSLAEFGKDAVWHRYPRVADPIEIASWCLLYDSPSNDFISSHTIKWHMDKISPAKWRGRELASNLFIRRIAATREAMRLWRFARLSNCHAVAPFLSIAGYTSTMAHGMRGRGLAIVFLPTDTAVNSVPQSLRDHLLSPAGAGLLKDLIRAHHVPEFHIYDIGNSEDPLVLLSKSKKF